MVIVLVGNEIHLAIILYTFCRIEDRIYAMAEVSIKIKPFPHNHRIDIMVLDWSQIGVAYL